MRVYINGRPAEIMPGMKVKHALINAGLMREIELGKKVYDEWGNELGLDGAISEGMRIFVEEDIRNTSCQR